MSFSLWSQYFFHGELFSPFLSIFTSLITDKHGAGVHNCLLCLCLAISKMSVVIIKARPGSRALTESRHCEQELEFEVLVGFLNGFNRPEKFKRCVIKSSQLSMINETTLLLLPALISFLGSRIIIVLRAAFGHIR